MKHSLPSLASWAAQIVVIGIFSQQLYLKFIDDAGAVQLFEQLGMEPQGRILVAILELIACILLLIPSSVSFGAVLGSALMTGALIGHATVLGWEGEQGEALFQAVTALLACMVVLYIRRYSVPLLGSALKEIGEYREPDKGEN